MAMEAHTPRRTTDQHHSAAERRLDNACCHTELRRERLFSFAVLHQLHPPCKHPTSNPCTCAVSGSSLEDTREKKKRGLVLKRRTEHPPPSDVSNDRVLAQPLTQQLAERAALGGGALDDSLCPTEHTEQQVIPPKRRVCRKCRWGV